MYEIFKSDSLLWIGLGMAAFGFFIGTGISELGSSIKHLADTWYSVTRSYNRDK